MIFFLIISLHLVQLPKVQLNYFVLPTSQLKKIGDIFFEESIKIVKGITILSTVGEGYGKVSNVLAFFLILC